MRNYITSILSFFDDENSKLKPYIQPLSQGSISLYMFGIEGTSEKALPLYLEQGGSISLIPSGDSLRSPTDYWLNSDGNVSNMWSYVNEEAYDSLDTNYIVSFQSGQVVRPQNIYWVADSGIIKFNMASSGLTKIMDGNSNTILSSHVCYNPIDDYIYYGIEDGANSSLRRVDVDGNRVYSVSTYLGAGLSFYNRYNSVISLSKDGAYRSLTDESTNGAMPSLLGREIQNRRTRIDETGGYLYALDTETTNYLTRLYRYNFGNASWEYLKILSYGLFGSAFDIDFQGGNIYYTGTTDFFSANYHGIIKESITSGSGVRIVSPAGLTYFQTQELRYNNYTDELYYVAEDVSNPNKVYNLIKTDASGNNPVTVVSTPDHSGMKAMDFDGSMYKSYIDFNLTDFNNSFGSTALTESQVSRAFVQVKGQNLNSFSYIRAKVISGDKQSVIWNSDRSNNGIFLPSSGVFSQDIGNASHTINPFKNTVGDWNDAILRVEVAGSPSGNTETTRIYAANVTVYSANAIPTEMTLSSTLYTQGIESSTGRIPLYTTSDSAVKSLDLYLSAGSGVSDSVTLFTIGNTSSSGTLTLYTLGQVPSGNIPLYTAGHIESSSGIPLYTIGVHTYSDSMPLFLKSVDAVSISSGLPLYTYSTSGSGLFKSIPLFLQNESSGNFNGSMILYTIGYGGTYKSASMPLYLKSDTPNIGKELPLFAANYYSSVSSGIPLYLEAPSGTLGSVSISASLNLFVARDSESQDGGIPLYCHVVDMGSGGIPMYTFGGNYSTGSIPLSVSGVGVGLGNIKLYAHGF